MTNDSIKENLVAVKYCLDFDKSDKANWPEGGNGCLGFPALILLSSVIDTMGSYFRGGAATFLVDGTNRTINTVNDHFLVLNHNTLFKLTLSGTSIYDFYKKYRSPATHNNTLPPNTALDIGKVTDDVFEINSAGELTLIRLKPLYTKTVEAFEKFSYYLQSGSWSEDHAVQKDLKSRANASPTSTQSISLSGTGTTNKTSI